jgi:branched-chain amino acid transport system ATP-binding protein
VTSPLLSVSHVDVSYGDARALFDVSLEVASGEALAVLGANGAGKSSLAAAIGGAVPVAAGRIELDGVDVTGWPAHRMSRAGLAYVPEGRGIFPHLSVLDNLRVALRHAVPPAERAAAIARAVDTFPILGERRRQQAGTLSGGEQQMLSLARVIAAPPRLLVADEMSLGLAPKMVDMVFDGLAAAQRDGVTIVLVEQYVERALGFASRALILRRGRVGWQGATAEAGRELVAEYLGGEGADVLSG